jgi:D-proline reductase (dithiol) PrdB
MSVDDGIRKSVGAMPAPELPAVAAVRPRPLRERRVALVTTAALAPRGEARLTRLGDGSFTVLPAAERNLTLTHFSPNFDRSGITADLDVVYPIDRLDELAARGEIGSVAPRHLAFMGAQFDLATVQHDTGPAAAALLRDDGVDVVLLTPV